jgi:hypothetical protein
MPKSIQILVAISRHIIEVASGLGLIGWGWRFMLDVLAGVNLSTAMLICIAGLAATMFLGICIAHAIEFYLDRSQWADEGNRVADVLVGLRMGGHRTVKVGNLVNIWYSDQPENEVLRLATKTGLHARLRAAVRRGWLHSDNFPAQPGPDYSVDIDDAISFFRERRWLSLHDEPEPDAEQRRPEAVRATPRVPWPRWNWTTGWRDRWPR